MSEPPRVSLRLTDRKLKITGLPRLYHGVLDRAFGVRDPKAYIRYARNPSLKDHWDGIDRFYDVVADEVHMSIGFLPRLREVLTENGVHCEEEDLRDQLPEIEYRDFLSADDFQLDAMQVQACKALLSGRLSAIELEVASGKTEIMLNAACCFLSAVPGSKTLLIVPSRNLMRQTMDRIKLRSPSLYRLSAMLGDGQKPGRSARLVVATIASAAKSTLDFDGLLIDEAHRSKTKTVKELIDSKDFKVIWACSGKLTYVYDSMAGMKVEEVLGRPVFRGSIKERHAPVSVVMHDFDCSLRAASGLKLAASVANGVGVTFKRTPDSPWERGEYVGIPLGDKPVDERLLVEERGETVIDPSLAGVWVGNERVGETDDLNTVYDTYHDHGIMENQDRNRWAVNLMRDLCHAGEPFVVTTTRLRHAKKLMRMALKEELPVELVSGESSGSKQQASIKRLSDGTIAGIIAVYSTISEGVDIPRLLHLIKLDGICSEQVLTQQLGRLKRKCEGKSLGIMHVPCDRHMKHLAGRASRIASYYQNQGESVEYTRS